MSAPAGARGGPDDREVARAIAQERRRLAAQVRPDELPARAVLERQRLAAVGIDQLDQRVLAGGEMEPVALAAGACHRGPDVRHPERVGHARAPRLLDLGAHSGKARARLAGRDDVAQTELARLDAGLAGATGQIGREGERPEQGVDAEPRDQLEQPPRLAGAHRHHRRAAPLERHVVRDSARVERVVEAVRDYVVRSHARDPERLAADRAVRLVVGSREAHRHGLAGGPRGHVHAHEPLGRGA